MLPYLGLKPKRFLVANQRHAVNSGPQQPRIAAGGARAGSARRVELLHDGRVAGQRLEPEQEAPAPRPQGLLAR